MNKQSRIVIKIGTKVLTSKDRALDKEKLFDIVSQIADVCDAKTKVLVVTSGAIGAGLWLLNIKKRPTELHKLQAAASIGQSTLMHLYGEHFKQRGYLVGQILLTQEDFNDRTRYLNIKHTIDSLLQNNAIPIINENDTIATDEIRCGDNDRLSCLVADLCEADKLIILTDVDGLLDRDGTVISKVDEITPELLKLAGKSHCDLGTGGMATKIECARNITHAGIECIMANGKAKHIIKRIMAGEEVGTTFKSAKTKFIAKKRWIAFSSKSKGIIAIDDGATEALRKKDKSLLASGIIRIQGNFTANDVVTIVDKNGEELAKGLSNYSSEDLGKIKGLKTGEFKDVLGYKGRDEAVHKDNLALL